MSDKLRGGSTVGGYEIVTTKEVPMTFRVNVGVLQYSEDNGITWIDAKNTSGTATAAQLLSGYTAYVNGSSITGTMPVRGAATITPSASTQTIAAGYYLSGVQTISAVAGLTSANIKTGAIVGGVTGSYKGVGTATAAQVLTGYSFSSAALSGVAGTMPSRGAPTWTPSKVNQALAAGYYSGGTVLGDADLVAANILAGKNIFNVAGTGKRQASGSTTSTTVAATLGWQPSKVLIRYGAGGFMLLSSTADLYYRSYDVYGAYTQYSYYSIYMSYDGTLTKHLTTTSMTTTGFSIVVAGYYTATDTFSWVAYE